MKKRLFSALSPNKKEHYIKRQNRRLSGKSSGSAEAYYCLRCVIWLIIKNRFVSTLSRLLVCTLSPNWHYHKWHQLRSRDKNNHKDIIVRFTSHIMKEEVMKNISKLRGLRDKIFCNDDFTKNRSHLYKQARDAVRNKKAVSAWTRDRTIFMKKRRKFLTYTSSLKTIRGSSRFSEGFLKWFCAENHLDSFI